MSDARAIPQEAWKRLLWERMLDEMVVGDVPRGVAVPAAIPEWGVARRLRGAGAVMDMCHGLLGFGDEVPRVTAADVTGATSDLQRVRQLRTALQQRANVIRVLMNPLYMFVGDDDLANTSVCGTRVDGGTALLGDKLYDGGFDHSFFGWGEVPDELRNMCDVFGVCEAITVLEADLERCAGVVSAANYLGIASDQYVVDSSSTDGSDVGARVHQVFRTCRYER